MAKKNQRADDRDLAIMFESVYKRLIVSEWVDFIWKLRRVEIQRRNAHNLINWNAKRREKYATFNQA